MIGRGEDHVDAFEIVISRFKHGELLFAIARLILTHSSIVS